MSISNASSAAAPQGRGSLSNNARSDSSGALALMEHAADAEVFESDTFLNRCMGNLPLAKTVLHKFKAQFLKEVEDMRLGFQREDTSALTRIAHRLKGASASVSAQSLALLFSSIEEASRASRLNEVQQNLDMLQPEWDRFWEHAVLFIQQNVAVNA